VVTVAGRREVVILTGVCVVLEASSLRSAVRQDSL
jgi:hypothetical protein